MSLAIFPKKRFFAKFEKQAVQDYVSSVTTKIENTWQLSYQPEIEAQVFRTIPTTYLSIWTMSIPSLLLTGRNTDVTMPFLDGFWQQPNFTPSAGVNVSLECQKTASQLELYEDL